ncbi:MAG: hypothetical protein L3K02_05975 [Thermoplasmata archaeon]|nr:hypothetical protein [Thermoplasmata archaeon]
MPAPSGAAIPQREFARNRPSLSLLAFTVTPSQVPAEAADRSVVERLRQARRAGVTTFDLADSTDSARSERLFREAFPSPDPALVVIVGRRIEDLVRRDEPGLHSADSRDGVEERLRLSLEVTTRRLRPHRPGILEWTDDANFPLSEQTWAGLGPQGPSEPYLCRRLNSGDERAPLASRGASRSELLSGDLSLLETKWVTRWSGRAEHGGVGFLARDSFAGGRLDGTRASGTGVERGPSAGPIRLRELEAEFAPLLRLSFLTEDRRRTMAQAAVRYAAHWPWVKSVIVPLPTSDRIGEVLASFDAPAISAAEMARVSPPGGASHPERP